MNGLHAIRDDAADMGINWPFDTGISFVLPFTLFVLGFGCTILAVASHTAAIVWKSRRWLVLDSVVKSASWIFLLVAIIEVHMMVQRFNKSQRADGSSTGFMAVSWAAAGCMVIVRGFALWDLIEARKKGRKRNEADPV